MRTAALLAAASVVLLAGPVHAGRALDEPRRLKKLVRAAPRADVEKALTQAGALERCKDALADAFLTGVECRAVAAVGLVRAAPVAKKADVDARASLFADLAHTAASVSSWTPLVPQPALGQSRFEAHRAIARGMMALYDDLAAAGAADARAAAQAFLRGKPDPKNTACHVAARSVELAGGADASLAERGEVQALLTSHACFLDESRLASAPKPGALAENKDAARVAASTSAKGLIADYAQTRRLDVQRCIDKHIRAGGQADDVKKLESCTCGAIQRWRFPAPHADTDAAIALSGPWIVRVSVAANGALHTCGPVVSASAPP